MPLDGIHTEYCMMETFQLRCWKNEVILMMSSVYGRMDRNARCLESDPWKDDQRYMDCSADVLSLTDRRCSGRREAPNTEFHRTKPCGTANVINITFDNAINDGGNTWIIDRLCKPCYCHHIAKEMLVETIPMWFAVMRNVLIYL